MKREEGFTLVELLIAVMLLAIVMGALIGAMILSLRTLDSTRQKVTDTTGAQLVASWLVGDAQSANHVDPATTCDSSAGNLLELQWTNASDDTTITDVVYKAETADATNMQLSRVVYAVVGGTCTQTTKQQLVRDISTSGSNTRALCTPSCTDSATRVGLHITAFSTAPNSSQYASYTFEVYGSRRAS